MSRYIGIDFDSAVLRAAAVVDGRPTLIPLDEGNAFMPALACVDRDGRVVCGAEARRMASRGAAKLIRNVSGGWTDGLPVLETREGPPVTIVEALLRRVVQGAKGYLKDEIGGACVAVPPSYTPGQRMAVVQTLKACGLRDVRLLSDTVACARSYRPAGGSEEFQLVCDMGGDGFSVSVLDDMESACTVEAHARADGLGGGMYDARLAVMLADAFRRQTGVDLKADDMAMQRLCLAAEEARETLAQRETALVYLPFVSFNAGGPVHLEMKLTRRDLETLYANMAQRMAQTVQRAVKDSGDALSIDRLLVRGCSRYLPALREALRGVSDSFKPSTQLTEIGEDGRALGAACYAAKLAGDWKEVSVNWEVTGQTVGIALADGACDPVIPRNTTFPGRRSYNATTSRDGQTELNFGVMLGEGESVADNARIANVKVTGIEPAPAGKTSVDILLDVDINGVVSVGAMDARTKRLLKVEVAGSVAALEPPVQEEKKLSLAKAAAPPGPAEVSPAMSERDRVLREVMLALLPSVDNLERALAASRDAPGSEAIVRGVELTLRGLMESLGKLGLKEIPALNAPFDPNLHDAIESVGTGEPGRVIAVVEKGYWLNGRVLRYARVHVSE